MSSNDSLPISRILQFLKDTQASSLEWVIGIKISRDFAQRIADMPLEDWKTSRDSSLPIEQKGTSNDPKDIFEDFQKLHANGIKKLVLKPLNIRVTINDESGAPEMEAVFLTDPSPK